MFDRLTFQKTTSINSQPLLPGQVHLWWLSLEISDEQQQVFQPQLSEHQQKKLERLQDLEKRRFYIAGRGYLRQFLAHYTGLGHSSEQSLELQFSEHGKPSLKNNVQDLCFNFTDTCGYGLFAFALSSELGVDVENGQRTGKFDRVIQRRFSEQEQYLLGEEQEGFLRCWTRKEAYGKAIGAGLNYPLREHVMCVDLSKSEFSHASQNWYGQQFSIQNEAGVSGLAADQEDSANSYIACLFSAGNTAKTLKAFHLQKN